MSQQNYNTSDQNNNIHQSFTTKRTYQRYVNIQENVFKALSPYAYKVYTALRFQADFGEEVSKVSRTVAQIAEASGISQAKTYTCFNELEDMGLLQRESKTGFETVYHLAQELYSLAKPNLVNNEVIHNPSSKNIPPLHNIETPPPQYGDHPINLSITKNNTHTARAIEGDFILEQAMFPDSEQYRKSTFLREQCLKDEKSKLKHEQLQTKGLDKTFEEVLDECITHYATQKEPQLVSPQRLQSWLNRDERYFKTREMNSKPRIWVEKEDRAANNEEIAKREKDALEKKNAEIAASPQFMNIVTKVTERFAPKDKLSEYNTAEVRAPRERPVALKELLLSLGSSRVN
jgi:hypothetical protein